jgi:hypothetical protein
MSIQSIAKGNGFTEKSTREVVKQTSLAHKTALAAGTVQHMVRVVWPLVYIWYNAVREQFSLSEPEAICGIATTAMGNKYDANHVRAACGAILSNMKPPVRKDGETDEQYTSRLDSTDFADKLKLYGLSIADQLVWASTAKRLMHEGFVRKAIAETTYRETNKVVNDNVGGFENANHVIKLSCRTILKLEGYQVSGLVITSDHISAIKGAKAIGTDFLASLLKARKVPAPPAPPAPETGTTGTTDKGKGKGK